MAFCWILYCDWHFLLLWSKWHSPAKYIELLSSLLLTFSFRILVTWGSIARIACPIPTTVPFSNNTSHFLISIFTHRAGSCLKHQRNLHLWKKLHQEVFVKNLTTLSSPIKHSFIPYIPSYHWYVSNHLIPSPSTLNFRSPSKANLSPTSSLFYIPPLPPLSL